MGPNKYWFEKMLCPENLLFPGIFFVKKDMGQKRFGLKIFEIQEYFWSSKMLVKKNEGVGSKITLGPKQCWVTKTCVK